MERLESRELLALGDACLPVDSPPVTDDYIVMWGNAGEPTIAQDPDLPTYYQPEPLRAQFVSGGGGADFWQFSPVINAKPAIIAKHTREDGTVNWGMDGVAGENDNPHDHWVEGFGDVSIMDFDADDRILIEGHTTVVHWASYGNDYNQNGTIDTRIMLRSDQGGAGAHDGDDLGWIILDDYYLQDFASQVIVQQRDHGIAEYAADVPERTPNAFVA